MPVTMMVEGRVGCAEHDVAVDAGYDAGGDDGERLEPEIPLSFPYRDRCSQTPPADSRLPFPSGPSSGSASAWQPCPGCERT